jgi:hypothetical protein
MIELIENNLNDLLSKVYNKLENYSEKELETIWESLQNGKYSAGIRSYYDVLRSEWVSNPIKGVTFLRTITNKDGSFSDWKENVKNSISDTYKKHFERSGQQLLGEINNGMVCYLEIKEDIVKEYISKDKFSYDSLLLKTLNIKVTEEDFYGLPDNSVPEFIEAYPEFKSIDYSVDDFKSDIKTNKKVAFNKLAKNLIIDNNKNLDECLDLILDENLVENITDSSLNIIFSKITEEMATQYFIECSSFPNQLFKSNMFINNYKINYINNKIRFENVFSAIYFYKKSVSISIPEKAKLLLEKYIFVMKEFKDIYFEDYDSIFDFDRRDDYFSEDILENLNYFQDVDAISEPSDYVYLRKI